MLGEILLGKVHPKWKAEFVGGSLSQAYSKFYNEFSKLDHAKLTPPPKYVMASFAMDPESIKCVIIGQDPYTKPGAAIGHAFACKGKVNSKSDTTAQESLKNIFEASGTKDSYLYSWINQGVWLLNTSLLANLGGPAKDARYNFTKVFVRECLAYLCEMIRAKSIAGSPIRCGFMLWGKDSQEEFDEMIKSYGSCMKTFNWLHPSPLANMTLKNENEKFKNCTNFTDFNVWFEENGLHGIHWSTKPMDYSLPMYIAFSDGSCLGNGKDTAKSGIGVCIYKRKDGVRVLERFSHSRWFDFYEKIYTVSRPGMANPDKSTLAKTSPRAELEAFLVALEYIYGRGVDEGWIIRTNPPIQTNSAILVTDSELSINVALKFMKAGKNLDLLDKVWKILEEMEIRIEHINSHRKISESWMPFWAIGNEEADKLAGAKLG